jgi:hypothetical protein
MDVNGRGRERWVISDSQFNHRQPVMYGQNGEALLVGGERCWHEEHSVQVERRARFFCCQQVSEVNGVEGSPEDAKPQVANSRMKRGYTYDPI